MLTEFVKIASVSDLADGEMRGVAIGETQVLVARAAGQYYAVNNVCSHFYTLLSNGDFFPAKCQVQCPLHDSCFDLRTGEPIDPPAEDPIEVYEVQVEGDDIFVGPKGKVGGTI
jgi:3-phenylpropionate/trans-cinnamate dioxygenase ferredoxin subunit